MIKTITKKIVDINDKLKEYNKDYVITCNDDNLCYVSKKSILEKILETNKTISKKE